MEGWEPMKRFAGVVEKYKYAALVAVAGLLLMLLPGKQPADLPQPTVQEQETMEELLEAILSRIEGAGQVKVLLSEQTGQEILYQTDTDEEGDGTNVSRSSRTVIVSDDARNEAGLIRRTDPPRYLGAVVVCQGGDSPQVRLAVVEAVSCATGLSANQISVLKMK